MEVKAKKGESGAQAQQRGDEMGIRKGPWTVEEDTILVNYVATHGDGRWNSVARCAGLKRSGKSCRLRWLNYLRPDVRRGNITLQEQILILDLHSRWGNRWSKIAQHLPGRTDNEIKNYWRTRVVKQAKQLKCDVNSKQFRDALRYVWMPRLLERIRPESEPHCPTHLSPSHSNSTAHKQQQDPNPSASAAGVLLLHQHGLHGSASGIQWENLTYSSCGSGTSSESSSVEFQVQSDSGHSESSEQPGQHISVRSVANESDLCPSFNHQMFELGKNSLTFGGGGGGGGDSLESLWNDENIWFLRQQLCDDLEIKDNFLA